jgi:uncharacterized protein (DUF302 family)
MLYERQASGTVSEVVEKLKTAAAEHNFGVINVLDLKERMAAKNVDLEPQCQIVEVCDPRQAKQVLERNLSISTAMPCRISVFERSGATTIATIRPSAMLTMFGNPELEQVARDVEATMLRIIDAACA